MASRELYIVQYLEIRSYNLTNNYIELTLSTSLDVIGHPTQLLLSPQNPNLQILI